jgi:tetratricopeptide (TPR) repeat protein
MNTRNEHKNRHSHRRPAKIVCFAHENEETFRNSLEKHFTASKLSGLIDTWHNIPGTYQIHEIQTYLASADLIFFMISPSSIGDILCQELLHQVLERSKAGEVRLVPIWTLYVDYKGIGIDLLQVLPRGAKPVKAYEDRDKIYVEIVQETHQILSEIHIQSDREVVISVQAQLERVFPLPQEDLLSESHSAYEQTQRGNLFLRLEKYSEALSAYEEAIRLNPNFGLAYRGKGRVYEALANNIYSLIEQFVVQSLEIGKLLDTYAILKLQSTQAFEKALLLSSEQEELE